MILLALYYCLYLKRLSLVKVKYTILEIQLSELSPDNKILNSESILNTNLFGSCLGYNKIELPGTYTTMKDVIDVMALQNNRRERRLPDYRNATGHSLATNFIFECGVKLGLQPATVATAAVFYHKFFKEADNNDYDCYVICTACLCAAGKSRDEPVRLRDAVNVAHNSINRGAGPLELGEEYWSWRGAVAQAELLVLRLLGFNLDAPSPHRYLLHYLRSLQEWFPPSQWRAAPIARAAMAFLQDFHHSPSILDYRAPHIAVASLTLALHVLGVSVPLAATLDDDAAWYSVFTKDLQKEKNWEIMEKIMQVYSREPESI